MTMPRLLTGLRADRALSLHEHERAHGILPPVTAALIDAIEQSGLRGRGGASFPAGRKLRSVAGRRGPRVVLVNGAEGEPMSAKDRVLLHLAPHLVLDGAIAAAEAVGARSIVVAVPGDARPALSAIRGAASDRRRRGIKVAAAPVTHLAGEETALINHLSGGPCLPTSGARPFERGLRGRPTLVHNPETFAHIATIHRHGPQWFREVGPTAHPGSALVTVSGAVRNPGVREIPCGLPLRAVLDDADLLEPLRAVLVGGFHGVWVPDDCVDRVTLDDSALARFGGGLGAGVIVALGESACPIVELDRVVGWLAGQSARQCGPCANGLPALAGLVGAISGGCAPADASERLQRWSRDIPGRGACSLPDGAVRFLRSGAEVFADELADHATHGPCSACNQIPTLMLHRDPTAHRHAA
jgi:NADH:ubiquinone oxidoreductase subunit F (NADH-binding)